MQPLGGTRIHRQLMPPAAKNLFVKRFPDLQKLLVESLSGTCFFFVSLRVTSWLKLDGGFRGRCWVLSFKWKSKKIVGGSIKP